MEHKATIIVFSKDLDKVLAAFNIAIGAASMNMETTMFFTFWGLNVIRKEKSVTKSPNYIKRILGMLNPGGANKLKLSNYNMLGIGTKIMKRLMKKSNMPNVREFISIAKDMGVKIIGTDAYGFDRPFPVMFQETKEGKKSSLWPAHFAGRDKEYLHIEKLANLEKLPSYGFIFMAFPILIKKASAGWVRAVAIVPKA